MLGASAGRLPNGGCARCGREPTERFRFKANSGFLFFRKMYEFDGNLCAVCATGVFREFQAHNIIRGPWGIVSFFASIEYLRANLTGYRKVLSSLAPPKATGPAIDEQMRGKPIHTRPLVWLVTAVVAAFIVMVAYSLVSSPDATQPFPTESSVWQEGACVDFGGDLVKIVSCSSSARDGQITAVVSSEAQCPRSSDYYVELNGGSVACISTP